jgi:hypothetical protein
MEPEIVKELRDIIQRHTVRYEVWPHYEISNGKRAMVGFDLELHGTHDHGTTKLSPGCALCLETFRDLRRVAEWVLPKEERLSQYEIPPFDHALHASSKGPFEVVLPIKIEHRHNFFDPVDSCEERCLREMQAKLTELGAPGGRDVRTR